MTQMTDLIFSQLESLSEDDDISPDLCRLFKIMARELREEFARANTTANMMRQQMHMPDAPKEK